MKAAHWFRWVLPWMLSIATVSAEPFGLAVNSDDAEDADQLVRVDLATGAFSFIGPLPMPFEDVEGLTFTDAETLYGVDNATKTLLLVTATTGAAQPVASRRPNLGFSLTENLDFGMTFTCQQQLLLVAEQRQSLYELDPESGQARLIGEAGSLGDQMTAIASYGNDTYALAADSNGFYRLDIATATATLIATIGGDPITDAGMAFDENGVLWAILDGLTSDGEFLPSQILRIDPQSGTTEVVAQTRSGIESLAIGPPGGCRPSGTPSASAVPSLSAFGLVLMICTLFATACYRLRRFSAQLPE